MILACERILAGLDNVKEAGEGKWTTRCPAHHDRENSLSVGTGDDGRILLKCFAGCDTAQIIAALGLTMADLFPARREGRGRGQTPASNTATL